MIDVPVVIQPVNLGLEVSVNPDGLDGISVVGAAVNTDGDLIIRLSNGREINAGSCIGQPGPAGNPSAGISNISKVGTVGAVDTYRIHYANGATYDFCVTNGSDGSPGAPGVGVVSASINAQGQLVLLLSNNTSINAGTLPATSVVLDGTSYLLRTGTTGEAGYITFVLEE